MPTTQPVDFNGVALQFIASGVIHGLGFIAGMYAWRLVILFKNQSRFFVLLMTLGVCFCSSVLRAQVTPYCSWVAGTATQFSADTGFASSSGEEYFVWVVQQDIQDGGTGFSNSAGVSEGPCALSLDTTTGDWVGAVDVYRIDSVSTTRGYGMVGSVATANSQGASFSLGVSPYTGYYCGQSHLADGSYYNSVRSDVWQFDVAANLQSCTISSLTNGWSTTSYLTGSVAGSATLSYSFASSVLGEVPNSANALHTVQVSVLGIYSATTRPATVVPTTSTTAPGPLVSDFETQLVNHLAVKFPYFGSVQTSGVVTGGNLTTSGAADLSWTLTFPYMPGHSVTWILSPDPNKWSAGGSGTYKGELAAAFLGVAPTIRLMALFFATFVWIELIYGCAVRW